MADADVAAPEGGGGIGKVFSKKIGPLPAGAWLIIAAAIFWVVFKKNKGGGTAGQQTDPAGNVGTINPRTGYVYGSAEDSAALGSVGTGLGSSPDTGTGGSTVGGKYEDNNAWAIAAINYLVSIGIDATTANAAITQFLASQKLTTEQQAAVNLAIQRLGAPPTPPEPGGSPPPIVTPPGGATNAANPPTGFTTTHVTTSTIGVKWNAATNATSYTVTWGKSPNAADGTVTASTTSATVTNLHPGTLYHIRVQANPAKVGAPYASLTRMTAKAGPIGGGGQSPQQPKPSEPKVRKHTVAKDGESFSSIASQYKYKPGGIALWKYNYSDSPHTAEAKKKIKERGPNLLYHGETVYIPGA